MPVRPDAPISVSAFSWVPGFARGYVRDLRVRWALEEAGRDYAVRLMDAREARPRAYLAEQPFGQVPSYRDAAVHLFESGAIVLHIGADCPALLPTDAQGRAMATAWVVAALNSVEPPLQDFVTLDVFHPGEAWTAERRPQLEAMVVARLDQLERHLDGRDFLDADFTAGDLMMASVIRNLQEGSLLETRPRLAGWLARCLERPAFGRALAAQMADFVD